jgi:transposase
MTHHQYNLDAPGRKLSRHCHRKEFIPRFGDEVVARMVESDLVLCEHYTTEINKLEYYIKQKAKDDYNRRFELSILDTIKGVGPILSLTIAFEIDDIKRFPTVQQFCSYSRLIKPKKTSAGKVTGGGGKKIGNPYLKWAFCEATNLMLRSDDNAKRYLLRLQRKGSKAKALGILTHKLGKAVYFMLLRKEGFNEKKFFAN